MLFSSSDTSPFPEAPTYTINYSAILSWLAVAQPLPQMLRAGRSSIMAHSHPDYGQLAQLRQ